ncbi:hypothetical protein CJ178_15140 [Rhodococcus sp. ACPA4]|uniref:Phenylacetate-coenzyme A ligase PaaK-like adenylate-forming protein n=2 Tax=Nocardiaceae TaxID=85025 RepID=A0A652YL23_NOCGL|nr:MULTISPECIES: hypothetical protein [Rhodococcus]NMD60265.1 hypothetical protein [Nocardia globerula]KJF23897.1 hypothetical protein SZ00_00815 [Rhodococcus sp. AD45]MDV6266917.1 hypothetical protein [Rhodococcus globerulus]MDV8069343.1 hypothetical protein [Rhodococcus sp. IEGM 1366]NRI67364.1 hypothetical protein [Rhodococcus sp. MS16]
MSGTTTQRDEIVERLDARFQELRQQVPVLKQRADDEGITEIARREDMIPLLFPHTTYKSYPESLIAKGQWAQLNRWLDSLSAHRVEGVDVSDVVDVDGYIDALEAVGHLVSSSSGTSGKSSFLNKSVQDREVSMQNMLDCLTDLGIHRDNSWHVIPVGPETGLSGHNALRDLIYKEYGRPDGIERPSGAEASGHYAYMARLSAMRKAMADGTAAPDELATHEASAAARQAENERRLRHWAEQIIEHRTEKIFFNSQFPNLFRLTEILRELGMKEGDITGENAMTAGGGLKGMSLPADYQNQIFRMLNIDPSRFFHYYSMQELNIRLPKCASGRYHVPSELVLFVLDKNGEALAPESDGKVEGRAAFFDTTVDGRWGGTITGDKISVELGDCSCGRTGPTVDADITRYSDLADDDKITCAGTTDAYVRGFLED